MESIFIGSETFEELEEVLKNSRAMLEKFPGDFGLELGIKSLEQFKESALLELKRRAHDEFDLEAIDTLEWLKFKGVITTY